jgi:hypothetical protein
LLESQHKKNWECEGNSPEKLICKDVEEGDFVEHYVSVVMVAPE